MQIRSVIACIIADGIAEVKKAYPKGSDKQRGAIDGFEACWELNIEDLKQLLNESRKTADQARLEEADDYWYYRYFQLQVEWVCNVLSAWLVSRGKQPIIMPTARGAAKLVDIVSRLEAA